MADGNGGSVDWLTKAFGALLLAVFLGWAASISTTISKVTELEPQIEQIQRTQQQHGEWIATWPTTGELAADVRQTRDIEFLFQEMADLERSIDELRGRLEADG